MTYQANAPLDCQGADNLRELGGYMNREGITLRKHVFLRADDLTHLMGEDVEMLVDYGITGCVDLRIAGEKTEAHPFCLDDRLFYHSVPLHGNISNLGPDILFHIYLDILENRKPWLLEGMRILSYSAGGTIFHCTAGKDRTGLIAMLILSVCDVCEEQIIADYSVSGNNNRENTKKQMRQLRESGIYNIPAEIFESRPETMERTLAYIREHYETPVDYLRSIGMMSGEIDRIREKLLK